MSTWTDRAVLDLRHSLRVLGKSPVFTAAAVLSLALGIGANTAIFSLVDAVMLRALPVESPQQLVQLRVGERRGDATTFTNPIWEEIRNRQQIFGGVFAFSQVPLDVGSGLENQFADGLYVSGDFFRTLHVPAFAGRLLTVDDDRRGGGTEGWVAVLGHAYWRDRYGASPSVIGSTIRLAGNPFTIVGVAPPGFFGVTIGSRFDIAIPLAAEAAINRSGSMLDRRGNWWVSIMGRLKPGQSLEQAQAGLHALAPQVREATLPTHPDAKVREAYLTDPLTLAPASTGASPLRARYRMALLTLMGAVALVLLIACANLANLLLARASARRKEFALRLALGASRGRLVRQLLTESLLLALAGGVLGLLFARWAGALIVRQISVARSPIALDLTLDGSVLAFTMLLATLTACLFGLAPAFRSTDLSASALLRGSARSIAAGWRGFTLEKLLVVVQMAFSLVLIFGAALLVRSFASLATQDPGFDRREVLIVTADASPGASGQSGASVEQRRANARRLIEAWRALPGVQGIAATAQIPITNNQWGGFAVARDATGRVREGVVLMNSVGPGYFATMGTPILAGRELTAQDTRGTAVAIVVTEAFAREFFEGGNPVGQIVEVADAPGRTAHIVGLVKDSKYLDMRQAAPPTVFLAMEQQPRAVPRHFVVRGGGGAGGQGDAAALTPSLMAAVRGLQLDYKVEVRVFDTIVQDSLAQERLLALLSGFFGVLALLVAAIGLYGVMSLAVMRRRHELGIRLALGAAPASLVSMVLRDVAVVTLIGLALGALSGVLSGRLIAALLYGFSPSDAATWLLAIAALGSAAAIAGYIPARRAARVDPMLALREE